MTKEEKKQFGERLRMAIRRQGLTYENVANAMGASKQAVAQWTRGISIPRENKIYPLCELLNCSEEYLLYGMLEEEKHDVSLEELALAIVEMRDLLREIREELRSGKGDKA